VTRPSITVNGAIEPLAAPTIAALLAQHGIAPDRRGVAVALNGVVVARVRWAETALAAGDAIEIIKALAGG
jgi:sulfur carrier protein